MPKSASEPETHGSILPRKLAKKATWIQQRTRQALKYYSKTKKDALKSAKLIYLEKIGVRSEQPPRQEEEQAPRLRRLAPVRARIYKEESQSEPIDQHYLAEVRSCSCQSSLSSQEHYELGEAHLAALEVQRIIDGYLDYHLTNRKRHSLKREELLNYLRTTKYSLNCEKYLQMISHYNRQAYSWEENYILCKKTTGREIEERMEDTRQRMRRKRPAQQV